MRHILIFVIGSVLMSACASKVTTTGTAGATGKYSEDLSVWRPEAELKKDSSMAVSVAPERTRTNRYVEAKYAVTDEVNTVLDSIYGQNLTKRTIDGYT